VAHFFVHLMGFPSVSILLSKEFMVKSSVGRSMLLLINGKVSLENYYPQKVRGS
jgi:hypothetical protein